MVTKVLYLLVVSVAICNGFLVNLDINAKFFYKKTSNPYGKKYYDDLLNRKQTEGIKQPTIKKIPSLIIPLKFKYPVSKLYFEEQLKRLNSRNITSQLNGILNPNAEQEYELKDYDLSDYDLEDPDPNYDLDYKQYRKDYGQDYSPEDGQEDEQDENRQPLQIHLNRKNLLEAFGIKIENDNEYDTGPEYENYSRPRSTNDNANAKSQNFEVIKKSSFKFNDVGGYQNVKDELNQCIDILKNYQNYIKYNVRIPKGLILEGPPGTGKTLLAKALAGEAGCGFIAVSGADFQEKYVGVGSSRIKELFKLAKQHIPCIIFIDEIDAVGRKRSTDGESSSNERDSTLNALLVELDGFKNNTGIFLVSATNRVDLLDSALTRPGRIDKKIYIGLPDSVTRKAIIDIHINGKPHEPSIKIDELVEFTEGLSGAQIENLLNEAMLNALRYSRNTFTFKDFDLVLNKMMVGWQPNEHEFTSDIIDHIAIHEMGHAIVGIFSKHHSKLTKVVINFSSPKSPGYTVFESSTSNIYTREMLFEHLMILLSGRIAEEIFYGVSVTTGALNDFEEALKLAEKMVIYYGMGTNVIYPSSSDKYKELIDTDVIDLINNAYSYAEIVLIKSKKLIQETAEILKSDKYLSAATIHELINKNHKYLLDFKIEFINK
jgi:ATP-dependent metalloprotease FtsH